MNSPHVLAQQGTDDSQSYDSLKTVSFNVHHNKTIIPVSIGNARTLKIILDSGMGWDGLLIFNPQIGDSIDLVRPMQANLGGAGKGGGQTALVSDSMDFTVGKINFNDQRIVVLQGEFYKGFPSDGVMGYTLFGHYAVEVNYDDSTLILHDPVGLAVDNSWTAIPIYFKDNTIPWVDAGIVIGKEEPLRISCYIDYASSEAIELLLKPDQKFTTPAETNDTYLGRGLSGDIYGKTGKISKVILGPFEIRNVMAAFAPAEVRSKQTGADGVIAANLLRRFNLIFNYSGNKLYLKPNSHFNEPF